MIFAGPNLENYIQASQMTTGETYKRGGASHKNSSHKKEPADGSTMFYEVNLITIEEEDILCQRGNH